MPERARNIHVNKWKAFFHMSAVAWRSKGFPSFRQSITWGREPLGIYGEIKTAEKEASYGLQTVPQRIWRLSV